MIAVLLSFANEISIMSQVVILFALFFVRVVSDSWNYRSLGPDIWSDFYPLCVSQSQSPINILTACTMYRSFPPLVFTSDADREYHFILQNNGRTIIGMLDRTYEQSVIQLSDGGLDGRFDLVNFHIHWGENYKSGSEHQINGVKYAGEIHFVYHNHRTSQTAVVAFFIQTDSDGNQQISDAWQRYFHLVSSLKSENDSTDCYLNFTALMGENLIDFWRYEGSLTTPPCTEGIIWTIFKQPIIILENHLQILRNIFSKSNRHPQPIYYRQVYRNFPDESISSIPDYRRCISDITDDSIYSYFLFLLMFSSIVVMIYFLFWKGRDIDRKKKL